MIPDHDPHCLVLHASNFVWSDPTPDRWYVRTAANTRMLGRPDGYDTRDEAVAVARSLGNERPQVWGRRAAGESR